MNISARVYPRLRVVLALVGALLTVSWQTGLADTATFDLDAGYLRTNTGGALPSASSGGGALLLLVAAGGNNGTTFTNTLNNGQYVAGGDVILAAFSFNAFLGTQSGGTGKATQNATSPITIPTSVATGALIELRWFPSITYAQYSAATPATPLAGSYYGVYTPSLYAANLTATNPGHPDGGTDWKVPSGGATDTLNFYTNDYEVTATPTAIYGSQAFTEGYASLMVVPEPSTVALLSGGFVGLTLLWKRNRRARLG